MFYQGGKRLNHQSPGAQEDRGPSETPHLRHLVMWNCAEMVPLPQSIRWWQKVLGPIQLFVTLWSGIPPGSSVHRMLQA